MKIHIDLKRQVDNSYDLVLEEGVFESLAQDLHENFGASKYLILTDENVYKYYGNKIIEQFEKQNIPYSIKVLPPGEHTKSREYKALVEDFMVDNNFDRKSLLIAFGGGVIGDLGGFVASTFLRGIDFVQVPTTLLAMVDSSIGGKTAIDVSHGKNLVGAFWQPRRVYIDPCFLQTLPDEQFLNGLAEVIKIAITSDGALFDFLEKQRDAVWQKDLTVIQHIISHNAKNKAHITMEDEKESGKRAILNFGHTIGHAVELLSQYTLLHGQCVSIGMVYEARICEKRGYISSAQLQRIIALLEGYSLPVQIPENIASEEVIVATQKDKKAKNNTAYYVLIQDIGEVYHEGDVWTFCVKDDEVRNVL